MTTKIIHKKSSVSGKAPLAGQLDYGELALNTYDGVIYLKRNQGVDDELITIAPVSEDTLEIDTTGFSNSLGSTLAEVLEDLDSAITSAAVGGVSVNPNTILGAGTVASPFTVTLDSVLAGGGASARNLEVNNLVVNGQFSGSDISATELEGSTLSDIIALSIALG